VSYRLAYVAPAELERLKRREPGLRVEAFATACRINTLYMVARAGSGHIGTSFSCLDIVARLFLEDLRLGKDVYFSSKGHDAPALYAVLLGLGLLEFSLIHRLRRIGGLPGHPDISTPNVPTNTGSLGMGISKAKGMALARRQRGINGTIYVLLGDGELQEGQFWESLPSAANLGLGEIVAIVDHNCLQSDTWVAEVSDLGDLETKLAAFGWEVERCDGHDPAAVGAAVERLRVAPQPGILIADTVKGKGVSFMEGPTVPRGRSALYGFHSGAPSPEEYSSGVAELLFTARAQLGRELETVSVERESRRGPVAPQRLVRAYSSAIVAAAAREPRIVALDADLVRDTGLVAFRETYPDRFVECGIAEQDMVSTAGGLSLGGELPFVHSFACFLSSRSNEQIYNNATERTQIVYVGSLAGLLPGGPGHSHQCVRDIAALGAIPGLVMLEPCDESEIERLLDWVIRRAGAPAYIRLVSVPIDVPFELPVPDEVVEGRGTVLREPRDAVFLGAGPVVLTEAWHAADLLARRGIDVGVIELPFLNRVEPQWLIDAVGNVPLFTVDNHYVDGGQGDSVAAALALAGSAIVVRRIGVTRIPECGDNDEVLRAHELDAQSLARRVEAELRA
jgi:transketolase